MNNTEFTEEPICTASTKYQKLKINQLQILNLPEKQYAKELQTVLDKECLCVGLSNSASIKYDQPFLKNLPAVTICPGPNIAYFSRAVSLQEMTDHIYGRTNIIEYAGRPHVFINELRIYIDYLKGQFFKEAETLDAKREKYFKKFNDELQNGINYYRRIAQSHNGFPDQDVQTFNDHLNIAETELHSLGISQPEEVEAI